MHSVEFGPGRAAFFRHFSITLSLAFATSDSSLLSQKKSQINTLTEKKLQTFPLIPC